MVKFKKEEKESEDITEPVDMFSKWKTKKGELTAGAKKLKDRVLEFLEMAEDDVPYSDITNYLRENFESDYPYEKDNDKHITNLDVKFICRILAEEGKVIDR